MKFSLIIPAYNESSVIVPTLRSLSESFNADADSEWEIIVVDNASTDDTAMLAEQFGDPRIRVIQLREKGKGRALRAGFSAATGALVGFTDVDLSVPPDEIISAFRRAMHSPGAVVVGSRYHPESVMPGREWWRIGSSRIFNILSRVIVGIRASDTQCPLKVMDGRAVKIFLLTHDDTWFIDLEFIALLEHLRVSVIETPVTWNEHRYPGRHSKLSTVKDGFRAVFAMFDIRRRLPAQVAMLRNMG